MPRNNTCDFVIIGSGFGEEGREVSDPYFGGKGPVRAACNYCGGCMVGCRYNAKNTLPKNGPGRVRDEQDRK